ncbi:hypothetical protein TrCOL_g8685 [Triparma columacea]|uniref:RNA polymerase sigma-70 domain-containing protein n=1 Tax=Triparma columacea TaxID=722753 RepID=A0A9W7GIE6_9STRA|nr:hypothetical protein TrCOL_g8685 [Triparma columacea]
MMLSCCGLTTLFVLILCLAAELAHSFQSFSATPSSLSPSSSKTRWCSNVKSTKLDASENTETEGENWGGSSPFVKARAIAQAPLGGAHSPSRTALRAIESNPGINSGVGLFGRFGNINLGAGSNKRIVNDQTKVVDGEEGIGGGGGGITKKKNSNSERALTVEEEHELSKQIQILCKLKAKKDNLAAKLSRAPTDDEWAAVIGCSKKALLRQIKKSQVAKGKLVAANAGIVRVIARNYENSGVVLADLIQEGNLGLLEAADRFNPEKGFKFCTYAAWWVRQRIGRSIAVHSRVIRLPVYVHNLLGTMAKTTRTMTMELGRKPTDEEVATRMKVPVSKLRMYAASSKHVLSLELPVSHRKDDKRTLSDSLTWDGADPVDNLEVEALRNELVNVMDELDDKEKMVVRMRFGLDDGICKTRPELAEALNVSRERARLIENKAINKLRHPSTSFRLKVFLSSLMK